MRVCIVTPSAIGPSETFIRAHVELLPHDVVELYGSSLDFTWNDHKLSDWHKEQHRHLDWLLNLLPRYFEFRLRRKFFSGPTNLEIASDFLTSQNIDVVLAEYGTVAALITPACQAAGIPLVAHFHGFDASRHSILQEFADAYKHLFDYAYSVISVSNAMSLTLKELGCLQEKIRYNPCSPDSKFMNLKPDYSCNTLIAVGRHTYKKAPYLTLEAFRRAQKCFPELKLCFIGDGELFEITKNLVRAYGLESHVEVAGVAAHGTVRERLENAFAFVQHSIRARDGDAEGTPVAIMEAGAAGLPVIATRHGGISDVVVDGETGFLVPEHDVEAMANRIIMLAGDRDLASKLGKQARDHISRNFSMDKHLSVLNDTLCAAVSSTSRNAL